MNAVIRTTCPYCGVGCGVLASPRSPSSAGLDHRIVGDPEHPANAGRLCSKGSALGETLELNDRLLHPLVEGRRTDWDTALDHVAQRFRSVIAAHGPQAVAFYVSGQLLTEDYYVANKLMKGFIGGANIDTNSRLCMSSAVAGHRRAFGEDLVPVCYEDLELADLVVLVGSNTAWCHPILFQRVIQAKQQRPGMKIVVVDPRHTATCELADMHLPLRSGTDVWLFNGLLSFLHRHGAVDAGFVARHTRGLASALAAARDSEETATVARACGIDERRLVDFYDLFTRTDKTVTVFSQGVNQSSSGTDKVNSIINCHLLTGRIGRPGMGPFSVTGQPNAMGGREVGGLANMLAAHMNLDDAAHRRTVQTYWNSPSIADTPGFKAVDLFDAIHTGQVKAVWIMATNPVVSLPDADKAREALRRCELVVVSDCVERTDTNALAHVMLPAAAWGEKDGTVTNSERRISRQRAFMALPGQARPDWWIISQVAQRMGYEQGFGFSSVHEIFLEHAALSGMDNGGARAFDISALASLSGEEYDALAPVQWPVPARGPGDAPSPAGTASSDEHSTRVGTPRLMGDGHFYHADGRARFVPAPPRAPAHRTCNVYPLILNTGRIRDQWHTMTRSGKTPRLSSHLPEPFVDMHAQDALLAGVREGELARVSTHRGSMVARLRISDEMPRGMIFVPIHWSGEFCSDARVGALLDPVVDPVSGQPELKHAPARVQPFPVSWYGFVLVREPLMELDLAWWARSSGEQFMRYEIAGRQVEPDRSSWARGLLRVRPQDDWLEYSDTGTGVYRGVLLRDDRIDACIFVSPRADLPSRAWLSSLFVKPCIDGSERRGLLAGCRRDPRVDAGAVVCACFGVGRRALCDAIGNQGLTTVQEIGAVLRAGTHCGSCVPEIKRLLADRRPAGAA